LIRTLLAEEETAYWEGREGTIFLLSDEGLTNGVAPRVLFRGHINAMPTVLQNREISLTLVDVMGSEFSVFNLNKTFTVTIGDEHPTKPAGTNGMIYNLPFGEMNDAGYLDANREPADDGPVPARDCGDKLLALPDIESRDYDSNLPQISQKDSVSMDGGGSIVVPTHVFVSAVIGGVVGPPSTATAFLAINGDGLGGPSLPHAHREVWMGDGLTPDYWLVWITTVPGFHPYNSPLVDRRARVKQVSATPTNPSWPPGGWEFFVDFTSVDDGDQWGAQYVGPPINLQATVNTSGTKSYYYAVSSITLFGESAPSAPILVQNVGDPLDINLTWNSPTENPDFVVAYRVLRSETAPPRTYLHVTNDNATDGLTPELSYHDTGIDLPKSFNLWSEEALASPFVWAWMAVSLGEIQEFDVYGSDQADGQQPRRVKLDPNDGTILKYDSADWPYPGRKWVEFTNSDGVAIRQMGFFARGIPLKHHRAGTVTFTAKTCGYVGLNGKVINQAFLALQFLFNEFVLKNKGEGYRNGAYGPLETFENSDPILWTRLFQVAQNVSATLMNTELGFLADFAITEPMTVREIIRRFCLSYWSLFGINHHGQPFPILLNPSAPLTGGRLYRHPIELETITQVFAPEQRINRIEYFYDYDPDAQVYRGPAQIVQDIPSQQAHSIGGKKRIFNLKVEAFCIRDADTAQVAQSNGIACYRKAPRYVGLPVNLTGLHDEPGDRIRFTHWDGIGSNGDVNTSLTVMRHRINPVAVALQPDSMPVELIGIDMTRMTP
jgi:hypothetical protein